MRNSTDPNTHRQCELEFFAHVDRLLDDSRLRVDTLQGRRPASSLGQRIVSEDRELELKRLMVRMGVPDRDLQARMPLNRTLTVTLWRAGFFLNKKNVGRIKVVSITPQEALLEGAAPAPVSAAQVRAHLGRLAQSSPEQPLPTTLVVLSTSGFEADAHALCERRGEGAIILAEPNAAGGWIVTGNAQFQGLVDLFDPEVESAKRERVREVIDLQSDRLVDSSLSAEKIAFTAQLPLHLVESELKSYAKSSAGLVAKRVQGQFLLFREGLSAGPVSGGSAMPFWEKVTNIFRREESSEKKISRLAEERAILGQQRDRAYEQIAVIEQRESDLAQGFSAAQPLAQRRIATEIAQLRKDMERRHQILATIDKKVNVVNTAIHNLEMEQQLDPEKLKVLEKLATSSENVDAGMAALQQLDEEASAVTAAGMADLSDDAQSVFDELKAKSAAEPAEPAMPDLEPDFDVAAPLPPQRQRNAPPPIPTRQRSTEPEAG